MQVQVQAVPPGARMLVPMQAQTVPPSAQMQMQMQAQAQTQTQRSMVAGTTEQRVKQCGGPAKSAVAEGVTLRRPLRGLLRHAKACRAPVAHCSSGTGDTPGH